jgi:hypothetical protein
MSRLSYFVCAALLAGLVVTTSISAQGRGRGGFGFQATPLTLVALEPVQKEVGITDDQKAKLTELGKEIQEARTKIRTDAGITGGGGGQNLTDEQRAKIAEGQKKLEEEFTPKLKAALKPEQFERVQQIAYQAAGPNAFGNADIVKALDITKEQQEKITTINKDFQEKTRALFAGGGAGGGGREAMTKLREEQSAEVAKVLTKEQSDKWTTLKGKAFDTTTLFPGGRGRGGKGGDKKVD